jgi:oligopeptide/dipeptide ABC transporter ATP-binding protein
VVIARDQGAEASPAGAPLVSLRDVRLHFPVRARNLWPLAEKETVKAVDGVSFDIGADEIFGLAGESGCGKSTIARLVLDLVRPTSGEIAFGGRPIGRVPASELRSKLQIVFQDPYTSLNPRRSVGDILGEPLVIHTKLGRRERRERVMQMLEHVGLASYHYYRFPHEFSGGQRQRLAIARALMLNPSFLVLDEPTSALDVSVQAVILNLIRDLQREYRLGCLFITHDLNLMRFLSHRLGVMYLGHIVEIGRTAAVFDDPLHPYTKALIASTPQPEPERQRSHYFLEGELPSNIHPPSGCPFHTRCPDKIGPVCETVMPALQPHGDRLVRCHLYPPSGEA